MDVVILLFLFFGTVLVIARSSVADRMVIARFEEGALRMTLRGANRLWAGRSEVVVPLGSVAEARVESQPQALPSGVRLPGVWIPRLLIAGTYRKPGARSFFAIAYGRNALALDLENHEYDRVVVDVDEPERLAEEIRRAGDLP